MKTLIPLSLIKGQTVKQKYVVNKGNIQYFDLDSYIDSKLPAEQPKKLTYYFRSNGTYQKMYGDDSKVIRIFKDDINVWVIEVESDIVEGGINNRNLEFSTSVISSVGASATISIQDELNGMHWLVVSLWDRTVTELNADFHLTITIHED